MFLHWSLLLTFTFQLVYTQNPLPNQQAAQQIAQGNNRFAGNVYKQIAHFERGNFVVCPFSLTTVLALLHAGAEGDTSQQISNALQLPESKSTIFSGFAQILASLNESRYYDLVAANNIYIKDKFPIKQEYENIARNYFHSGIEPLDFEKNHDAAAVINRWVERQTREKIQNIVSPTDFDYNTRLILINALYFKGKWMIPFDPTDTLSRPFYVGEGSISFLTNMMTVTDSFKYYENPENNLKFLEMFYEGAEMSTTFILPNQTDGLRHVESNMGMLLAPKPYKNEMVRVQIPKFSMDNKLTMRPVLEKLGVSDIFTRKVNLNNISTSKLPLVVSSVLQKTFFNLTETGTEAAAASAVFVVPLSAGAPRNPRFKQFIADHPFMFYIKHVPTDTILFIGRYVKQ